MKVVCIVQARMGSTRLPGKVMKKICGETVLGHCINRIKNVSSIDEIVIATTTKLQDNIIEEEAKRLKVACFRGSEDNVLERYYLAAKEHNADIVIRITSDCPLIDYEIVEDIIKMYLSNLNFDYISNTIQRTYPRGLDTEVFSFNALEKAYLEAEKDCDKEHVTPYIWRNINKFNINHFKGEEDYSDIRITLDTKEDYKVISWLINEIENNKMHGKLNDIIHLFNLHPNILEINSNVQQRKVIM